MRVLSSFASGCRGRELAWRAVVACGSGGWGGAAAAAEVVAAGLKCMQGQLEAIGGGGSDDGWNDNYDDDYDDDDDDEIIRLTTASVGNAIFHSQAAAAAANHAHINGTVQHWLRLTQSPQHQLPPSPVTSSPPSLLPLSTLLLFSLQNLATDSQVALLISSSIAPSHLLPLLTQSFSSPHATAASSYAAGNSIATLHFTVRHPPSSTGLISNLLRSHPSICPAYAAASIPQVQPFPCTHLPLHLPPYFTASFLSHSPPLQALVRALVSSAASGTAAADAAAHELLQEALLSALTAFALQVCSLGLRVSMFAAWCVLYV
jgi:hypothetical protein